MRTRLAALVKGNYKKPCACGCGTLIWHLDVNKIVRNLVIGHSNTLRKKERKQIPCQCGCGELIWNYDKYCNGPNKFVKGHICRGIFNPHWKGGRTLTKKGYVLLGSKNRKRRFEHRIVWEQYHKACLLKWTDVHHLNGDKLDNRVENLEAITHNIHSKRTQLIVKQRRV